MHAYRDQYAQLFNAGRNVVLIAISADARATHQSVIDVMESARLAGYSHISFTTQRK